MRLLFYIKQNFNLHNAPEMLKIQLAKLFIFSRFSIKA